MTGLLRRAPRRAGGLSALLLAGLLGGCAALKAPAEPATPAAGRSSFRFEVVAPDALRELLEKHLDLARLEALPDDEAISAAELARLMGAAPTQARELVQTEGYFDAQVTVQHGDAAHPDAMSPVRLTLDPGPRTAVGSLHIELQGALAQRVAEGDADALALQAALPGGVTLQAGRPFRNSAWADTKQELLARLRAAGYAAASLADTRADIDAPAQSARLQVVLDSGPLFLAGPVQIEGLQHHDAATVRHLAGFGPGAALTEARLLDYQERLLKAGLFDSVIVGFAPDPAGAAATPVRVRISERPLQQATAGLGISANTGPRATLEHTHRRPLDRPVTLYNKLEWGRDAQSWNGDYQTHPGEGFYRNLVGVQLERVKSSTDVVLSQRLRLGRTQDTPRIERLYFAEWLRSQQDYRASARLVPGAASRSSATAVSGNYHLVWRQLDSVLLPTRGITLALQGGAGQAGSPDAASGPFGRLYGRLTAYLPLGRQWYGQARVEAGQIFKPNPVTVPDALGFRAGGDDSVRGYAYRSLAPLGPDGGTVSGQALLTTSVELARPIAASLPSVWGAVFVDAGRAVDHWRDYRPALGYGLGVRWRSPIGPLRADLAWGEELRKLRLHLSVGIAF